MPASHPLRARRPTPPTSRHMPRPRYLILATHMSYEKMTTNFRGRVRVARTTQPTFISQQTLPHDLGLSSPLSLASHSPPLATLRRGEHHRCFSSCCCLTVIFVLHRRCPHVTRIAASAEPSTGSATANNRLALRTDSARVGSVATARGPRRSGISVTASRKSLLSEFDHLNSRIVPGLLGRFLCLLLVVTSLVDLIFAIPRYGRVGGLRM